MQGYFDFYTLSKELNTHSIILRMAMLKNELIDSSGKPSKMAIDLNVCKVPETEENSENHELFLWDKYKISKIIH